MSFEKYSHVTGTIIMIRNISITQERSLTPISPCAFRPVLAPGIDLLSIPLPSLNFHINESFFHLEQCFWDSYTLLHVSATYLLLQMFASFYSLSEIPPQRYSKICLSIEQLVMWVFFFPQFGAIMDKRLVWKFQSSFVYTCIHFSSKYLEIGSLVYAQQFSCVQLFATPSTVAHQAPLSTEFDTQEYWSG